MNTFLQKWRAVRTDLLFWLCAAFALLFLGGMCAVLFADADVLKCAVPPFLGFCFTYPLWRRNRKQQAALRQDRENK